MVFHQLRTGEGNAPVVGQILFYISFFVSCEIYFNCCKNIPYYFFYCFYLRTGSSASSSRAASVGGMASTTTIKEEGGYLDRRQNSGSDA